MKKQFLFSLVVTAMMALSAAPAAFAQKLEAADVIAKHKAAIGTSDSIAAVKNQLIVANAAFTFKGGANVISGKSLVLSAGDKSLFGMQFASNDYPQDRFGFDGKNVRVGRATPSNRSLVGEFLNNNRDILKEGLFGGTLSSAWPLLRNGAGKARIKYEGTRTIGDMEAIVLSYEPKSGSEMDIRLFFDPKTFRHIRSEYTVVRNATQGSTVDSSASQGAATFRLVEEFSNFSKMGQLVLPRDYKVTYARSTNQAVLGSNNTNREAVWTFTVTDVGFNRELEGNAFDIDAK